MAFLGTSAGLWWKVNRFLFFYTISFLLGFCLSFTLWKDELAQFKKKKEEDRKIKNTDQEEKNKKIKDKQNKESQDAEAKLLSNIQKELNK